MQKKKRCSFEYNGNTYSSVSEVCRDLGISRGNITMRINQNKMTIQEALDDYFDMKVLVLYNEVPYYSYKEIYDAFDTNYYQIRKRTHEHSMTIEKALDDIIRTKNEAAARITSDQLEKPKTKTLPKRSMELSIDGSSAKPNAQKFTYLGVTYKSLIQACTIWNLDYHAIRYRMKEYSLSREEAFNEFANGKVKKRRFSFQHNGVIYRSMKEACEVLDVNYWTVKTRKRKKKQKIEQAFADIVKEKEERDPLPFKFQDSSYGSLKQACNDLGADHRSVLNRRTKYKITSEQALQDVLLGHTGTNNISFCFNGVTYKSFQAACNAYDLNDNDVKALSKNEKISKVQALKETLEKLSLSERGEHNRDKGKSIYAS